MKIATLAPVYFPALLGALALLMALMLAVVAGVERLNRISGWIFAPAGLIGLAIYLAAFLVSPGQAGGLIVRQSPWEAAGAVLQAVYATCAMFLGRQDYSNVKPLVAGIRPEALGVALQLLFWAAHLGALFVTASAILSTLGRKLLQTLRMRRLFLRTKQLFVIFGLNEQSVLLGQDLARKRNVLVLYIDASVPAALREQALTAGAVIRQGVTLMGDEINGRLMRQIGIGKHCRIRRMRLMMLDGQEGHNIALTQAMLRYLQACDISPDRVCIDLRCTQPLNYRQLRQFEMQSGNRYDVNVFSDAELSARLLVHESPPYETMTFDKNGKAKGNFRTLIIGFGQVGQNTLRQVIMNGQFYGSVFSADVVDIASNRIVGQFEHQYPALKAYYNIRYHPIDVRSKDFYALLDAMDEKPNYIVICLRSEEISYEIAADLERYFALRDPSLCPIVLVHVCNKRYVAKTTRQNIRFFERHRQVYNGDIFMREMGDYMAKAVNLTYDEAKREAPKAEDAWREADYFSRSSSRASADFIPAMLNIAEITVADAIDEEKFKERVIDNGTLLEAMSITEHMRWNAFHRAMGYTPMSIAEMKLRKERGITPLHKDNLLLQHACLIDWDALDALSKAVTELSGEPVNYKALDENNVRKIPRTLTFRQEMERG